MMPGIRIIWVLTGMTLQIVDKPLTLAMKIMVLIGRTIYFHVIKININKA
jgi:hypothetical protein